MSPTHNKEYSQADQLNPLIKQEKVYTPKWIEETIPFVDYVDLHHYTNYP